MRLFAAIYPPPEALDDLAGRAGRLRVGEAAAAGVNVRLTARENLHLTLAFLGDVEDARLTDVRSALARAASGWRRGLPSGGDAPLRLRLAGGGRFGRDAFTVLWVGVGGDVDALHALHAAVRQELRRGRLPQDSRPYRPHLTLARPGDRVDRAAVDADRDALHDYLGPSWPVTEIVLVRSHLGPRPLHHHLAAWSI